MRRLSPVAKDNNRKQKTCVPFRSSSSVPGRVFQITAIGGAFWWMGSRGHAILGFGEIDLEEK